MKRLILSAVLPLFILSPYYLFSQIGGATHGGPDAYGYMWRTNADTDPSKPTAKWIDISTRTGMIDITSKLDDDNVFGPINYSFDFPYYWYTRNQLYVSANGAILFKQQTLASAFDVIPTVGGLADDYVAPFLADLTLNKSNNPNNQGKVLFYTDFKDSVIISWIDVPFITGTGSSGSNTFQVVLSRTDQSITFNYIQQVGSPNGNGCTDGPTDNVNEKCFIVGIEDVNGQVGLPYVQGSSNISNFSGISSSSPLSIKYYRPASSSYTNRDLTTLWNNDPSNGGFFLIKGSTPPSLQSKIMNQGLIENPPSKVISTGKIFKQNTTTGQLQLASKSLDPLAPGKDTLLNYSIKIPTDKVDFYRFESTATWPNTSSTIKDGDQVSTNNKRSQWIGVIDTNTHPQELYYTGESSSTGFTWVGGSATYSAGVAVYVEPPYYPCKITDIRANFDTYPVGGGAPSDPIKVRIYDNDGTNLFGKKDGSPGTVLYDSVLLPNVGWVIGDNTIHIEKKLDQINSGGVYIAAFQGGSATSYGVEEDANQHWRGYEVFNEVFSPFRNNFYEDIMLGINIDKGDLSKILDLAIDSIISPQAEDTIKDSTLVKVRLRNKGNVEIKGPFDVFYRADQQATVTEVIPNTLTIPVGQTVDYTFKKQAVAPPAPRNKYLSFCSGINIPNDFDLNNNGLCFGEATGIKSENDITNFRIYPNPNDGKFNLFYGINQSADIQFEIYDLSGKRIYSVNLGNKPMGLYDIALDIPDLQSGLYICKAITGKSFSISKLSVCKQY